ncbi:MAG: potassium channel family protein [Actinomycetota bacterium]
MIPTEANRPRGRFGPILLSIVLSILATAAAGDSEWGRLVAVALMGATLLLILRTAHARPRVRLVAAVVVVLAILASALTAAISDKDLAAWALPMVGAFLALVAPLAIASALVQQKTVTYQTVLGALCLYLLAGMFFAFVYTVVGELGEGSFFVGGHEGQTVDYLYFSFVTLTTTGYGDLVAATDFGRMLAVTEALLGQLYLVSVVAVLAANLGRVRGDWRTDLRPDPPDQKPAE